MPEQQLSVEPPFDLGRTLTMSQALRWRKENGGWFSGTVADKLVMLRLSSPDRVEFRTSAPEESDVAMLQHYLGFDRDEPRFLRMLSECDPGIADLMTQHPGMRVLRPEPWECLITCVCSPGQRVRRLSSDIERLSEYHGTRLSLDSVTRYSFPKADRLAQVSVAELSRVALRMPRRAEYVHRLALDVANGELSLDTLSNMPHPEAKELLVQYGGVTPQIADCVLLFSLDKYGDSASG